MTLLSFMVTLLSPEPLSDCRRPDVSKTTIAEFEELVLLAALRLGDRAYGLSITNEILSIAQRPAVRASVYVTLRRLEKRGLIETWHEAPEDAPHGKPRRFVKVLPQALALLRDSRLSMQRMWSGIEDVLEDVQ